MQEVKDEDTVDEIEMTIEELRDFIKTRGGSYVININLGDFSDEQ